MVIQIETLRELLTTFQEVHTSQMKEVKKLQKQEEKHRKEAERESQRSLLKYALRTQTILNLIDDNAKETLQSGEGEDMVKLNESELNQLDEFYELVNPTRPGNERYVMRYYVMYLYLLSIYFFFFLSLFLPFPLSPSFSLSLLFFPLSPLFPSLSSFPFLSLLFPSSDMIAHYQPRLIISCICLREAQRKWHTQHVSYPYLVLPLLLYSLLSLHC